MTKAGTPMPNTSIERSYRDAARTSFWLDAADRPSRRPPLTGTVTTDLLVIGGGFSGLWAALMMKRRAPDHAVVLVEGDAIAWAASGRNGGFCRASLTHGELNGRRHAPDQYETLERLGNKNFEGLRADIDNLGIDCSFELVETIDALMEPNQVLAARGREGFLDAMTMRARVKSPRYLGGRIMPGKSALLNPARLAWGIADAAQELGVCIFESSPVNTLTAGADGITAVTRHGIVKAKTVALATNAFRPLLRRLRLHVVPVYDYVLVTEPLSVERLASLNWQGREGLHDGGNQFHYYRLTPDNRILYGGYDAIYHYGRAVMARYDQREQTFGRLAKHFFDTFPQLEGTRFTHRWGGAIDTCTRFFAFYGTAMGGRVAYALGHTGLGVAATRFSAQVMLDLLEGRETERTQLGIVRRKPPPFPPEPFAYLGIQATRWSLARADLREGRRNLWLRTLDRAGVGFDS